MPAKRPPRTNGQHHGDLKQTLIRVATTMVEDGEVDFSLRELARKAGVTAAAPYHHFASKAAVLDEIAIVGFAGLDEAIGQVMVTTQTPEKRLTDLVTAYLRFSTDHQAHYQLMFPPNLGGSQEHQALRDVAEAAFNRLLAAVRALRINDNEEDLCFWAFSVWALCHGFLILQRDGLIDSSLPFGDFEKMIPRIALLSQQLVSSAAASKAAAKHIRK
jgi:AcrR family transcriptional regulator